MNHAKSSTTEINNLIKNYGKENEQTFQKGHWKGQ